MTLFEISFHWSFLLVFFFLVSLFLFLLTNHDQINIPFVKYARVHCYSQPFLVVIRQCVVNVRFIPCNYLVFFPRRDSDTMKHNFVRIKLVYDLALGSTSDHLVYDGCERWFLAGRDLHHISKISKRRVCIIRLQLPF